MNRLFQFYKILFVFVGLFLFSFENAFAQLSDLPQTGQASYIAAKYAGAKTSNGEPYNPNDMTASHKTLPFGTKIQVTNLANQRAVIVRVNDRPNAASPRIVDVSDAAARALDMVKTGVADVRIELAPEVNTSATTATATTGTVGTVEAAPNGGTGSTVGTRILSSAITIFRDRVNNSGTTATTNGTTATTTPATTKTTTATTSTSTPVIPTRTVASGGFTLQLGFYSNKANADTVVRTNGSEAWAEPSQSNGANGYRVYYGRYATRAEAEAAKSRFPNAFIKAI